MPMKISSTAALLALLLGACSHGTTHSSPWTPLDASELSAPRAAQLERARTAQGEMMQTLMSTLAGEMARGGPGAAITVCSEQAPEITRRVGAEHGVRLGRTSHRLRNPRNVAPGWASSLLEERPAEPRLALGPEGTLGVTLPIHLQARCLGCHGEAGSLLPEVREALERSYPEDRATGFAEGDLRGWFWVEVPARTD